MWDGRAKSAVPAAWPSMPNTLFVADSDGNVHALDKSTGASVWKQDKPAKRDLGSPVVVSIHFGGDNEGLVHALSADKGELVGRFATDGSRVTSCPRWATVPLRKRRRAASFSIAVR